MNGYEIPKFLEYMATIADNQLKFKGNKYNQHINFI